MREADDYNECLLCTEYKEKQNISNLGIILYINNKKNDSVYIGINN